MLQLHIHHDDFQPVELNRQRFAIGRDAANDLVLSDSGVSGFHAEIHCDQGRVYLIDLGSTNGTFLNGKRISGRHELKAWDKIQFESVAAEIVDTSGRRPTQISKALTDAYIKSAPDNSTRMRPSIGSDAAESKHVGQSTTIMPAISARLIGQGSLIGKTFSLQDDDVRIGRTEDNQIVLVDSTVSANHARLRAENNEWSIEDLGSTNGTFVNNKKIEKTPLRHGDTLRLGKVELSFDVNAQRSGTSMMPTIDDQSETRTVAAVSKRSGWIWGVVGVVIIAVALGIYFFSSEQSDTAPLSQSDTPLQSGKVWGLTLPDQRRHPATPVLADVNGDTYLDIIITDANGFVLALDGHEGKKIFEAEIAGRILAPPVAGDLTGNGVDDVVVVSHDGKVTAFNGRGQVLWQTGADLNLGEVVNRPLLVDVNANGMLDVLVPTSTRGVVALDGIRGWEIWNTADFTDGKVISAPLQGDLNGDGTTNFVFVTDKGQVLALTSDAGRVWKLWEAQVSPIYYASPALVPSDGGKSTIVVATDRNGVIALDAQSGQVIWNKALDQRFFASPVVITPGAGQSSHVAVVADNGDIHLLDSLTGDTIWNVPLGTGVRATPALFDMNADGWADLLVLDTQGVLHVIDSQNGRILLSTQLSGQGFTASALLGDVNHDGLLNVIVTTEDGQLSVYGLNRKVAAGSAPWPSFLGTR